MAGEIVMAAAARKGRDRAARGQRTQRHFSMPGRPGVGTALQRIILTCSGGPFRATPRVELERVTPEMALKHPTWSMGRKISIDSATLFNKGLEMIEARWLFDVPMEKVDVVIHPQSIVHSMVEFVDGSLLAQLSHSDMCFPFNMPLPGPSAGFPTACAVSLDLSALAPCPTSKPPKVVRFSCPLIWRVSWLERPEAACLPATTQCGQREVAVQAFSRATHQVPSDLEAVERAMDSMCWRAKSPLQGLSLFGGAHADRPDSQGTGILGRSESWLARASEC